MRRLLIISLALCASGLARAADPVDLSEVDRTITKLPEFVAEQPLYGLAIIGKSLDNRVWMILDKSDADAQYYDLLYADLNRNGDLTEPAERFHREPGSGGQVKFELPDFVDPRTKRTHTQFYLSVSSRRPATQMISLLWNGGHKIGGGYPMDPDDGYLRFGGTPEEAPIVRLDGDGPFRFQRWYSGQLQIGAADDLKLFLGLPGAGRATFCAFQRHVLPAEEPVLATLIYTDREGQERRADVKLKERC